LISNDWYRALDRDDVDLIAHGVEAVTPGGVIAADGSERPADTIVLATGFRPTDLLTPLQLRGRGGVDVNDAWREAIHAHKGTTIAGFPNLFILTGPNRGTGHQSQLYMIECQHEYVLGALRAMRGERLASVEVRAQAESRFNDRVQARMQRTVWLRGGCSSWYLDPNGRNVTLWPSFTFQYRAVTAKFDRHNYDAVPAVEHAATPEEVAA
jgi:cation diffusion facilitator CzcD-associated flavoprotein CzcO